MRPAKTAHLAAVREAEDADPKGNDGGGAESVGDITAQTRTLAAPEAPEAAATATSMIMFHFFIVFLALPNARRARVTGDYFARFQTNSSVFPAGVLGLVNFSSSAVRVVMIRFCSGPPIRFANVPPSGLAVMTLSTSLTEYVPK
jgi:hypothetical protein